MFKNSHWAMSRRALWLSLLIVFMFMPAVVLMGCTENDPYPETMWTKNIYPALTDTYQLGNATHRWDTGYFREIWLNGAMLVPGVLVEIDPVFTGSPAFGITAGNIVTWNGHPVLTTGIHGVGAGDIVGTTLVQELDSKTLDSSVGKGTWTASGIWKLPAMFFNGDITTDRWLSYDTNTFLGVGAVGAGTLANTGGAEGTHNTAIGYYALRNITTSYYNTAVGAYALNDLTSGLYNTALGQLALGDVVTGDFNTAVGMQALRLNTGSYNTALGLFAGGDNILGSSNIFIGSQAGKSELGSNKLYIDVVDIATPLIYGDFNTDDVHLYAATKIGLDDTNYTSFEDDGTMEMVGDAVVWDDVRTPVTAVKLSGIKPPSWTSYKSSEVLGFSDQALAGNEEQIFFSLQLPHSYLEESDITPHIHWTPEDGTGGNVEWLLTYSWANVGGTFPAATTDNLSAAAGTTVDKHLLSSFATIDGTGKTISSMLLCSLKRNSSNALDTYNGKSAYFFEIDFHYQLDTIGSRTELAK